MTCLVPTSHSAMKFPSLFPSYLYDCSQDLAIDLEKVDPFLPLPSIMDPSSFRISSPVLCVSAQGWVTMVKAYSLLIYFLIGTVFPFSNLLMLWYSNTQALETFSKCLGSRWLPRPSWGHGKQPNNTCIFITRTAPRSNTNDISCETYSTQTDTISTKPKWSEAV